jgi:uncharacterized protein (TIGR02001 family)
MQFFSRLISGIYMRIFVSALSSVVLLLSQPVAAETVNSTGSVLLISDYLYRGISQTDEGPALQGSLTLATDSGWYASAWGSNIKFGQGSMELDISAGRSFAVAPDWTVDLGLMQYRYPKGDNSTDQFNFIEGYGKLIYQDWTFGLALTDDYFGAGVGKFWYLSADWNQQLTEQLQLQWHLGYNKFANALEFKNFLASASEDGSGYTDWGVKLNTTQLGLNWSVGYAGTSVSSSACSELCDNRVLISVGKNF